MHKTLFLPPDPFKHWLWWYSPVHLTGLASHLDHKQSQTPYKPCSLHLSPTPWKRLNFVISFYACHLQQETIHTPVQTPPVHCSVAWFKSSQSFPELLPTPASPLGACCRTVSFLHTDGERLLRSLHGFSNSDVFTTKLARKRLDWKEITGKKNSVSSRSFLFLVTLRNPFYWEV